MPSIVVRYVVLNLVAMLFAATSGTCRMSASMTGTLTCYKVGDPTSGADAIGPVPLSMILVALSSIVFAIRLQPVWVFRLGFLPVMNTV